MARRSTLARAVRLALVTGVSTGAGGVAYAQDAGLEQITVTGSRIPTNTLDAPRPVLMITRDNLEKQGFQNIADILQNLSAAGSPALSRAAPLSAGENAGGSFIDLRGLAPQRTLVLLDGKRLGISTSGFQDISSIPTAMIERIEVLKDGASSLYGSDAIGGVINIITRKNFDGIQGNAYAGQYDEGDGVVQKYDFIIGARGERSSLSLGAEWAREDGVNAGSRPFSAFPQGALHPTRNWTPVGQFGGFIHEGVRVILENGGDPRNIADYRPQDLNAGNSAANPEGSSA